MNPCRVRGAGGEPSVERPVVGPAVLIELADAIGPRWRAMVLSAGFAGLRTGELIALRRSTSISRATASPSWNRW
jgi:hypothetical protein